MVNHMVKFRLVTLVVVYMVLFSPNAVFAHKLNIVSWFQDKVLHIEGKFNSGKEIVNGNVEIFDGNGKLLSSGQVDQNGHFTFRVHEISNLKIVLSTPCGHKGFLKIPKGRVQTMLGYSKNEEYKDVNSHKSILQFETQYPPSLEQIELLISQQLESNLQSISKAIAYGQVKKYGICDILGGIGYIFGLIGLITYVKYSKT